LDHAKAQTELFEKASDENLILFFHEEIKRIDEGEKATDLLSLRVTKRLLDLGILARTWQNTLILGEKGKYIIAREDALFHPSSSKSLPTCSI